MSSEPINVTPPPAEQLPTSSSVPASTPPPATTHLVRTTPSGSDKIWAILSHVSSFIGVPFILPLVIYLAMKDESAYVAGNAKEALNFHLSLFIYGLCMVPLVWLLIGIPLLVVMAIGALVLSVIAAFKASEGDVYRYPLTLRLVS